MKSSEEQLRSRGYITSEDIKDYTYLSKSELIKLLESKEPYKRTIAVNLLSQNGQLDSEIIKLFCDMLVHEKKLYTKLELSNSLSKASVESAKVMVNYLGIIGNNQYKELPGKEFNKKSYPLPRDIIARTLAHMSVDVLPELMRILKTNNIAAIREVIDSIGFLCFYNPDSYGHSIVNDLISCFSQYTNDDIIRWKFVRAFESFNSKAVVDILNDIIENDGEQIIRNEAKRSLNVIYRKI